MPLSGDCMKIILPGDPITKKNSQRLIWAGGRPRVLPSRKFEEYQEACGSVLRAFAPAPLIAYPVEVKCLYYRKTKRRVDLTNLLEATDDILVHYGILADDHSGIIASHDGSRVLLDRESPRVEIEIQPLSSC